MNHIERDRLQACTLQLVESLLAEISEQGLLHPIRAAQCAPLLRQMAAILDTIPTQGDQPLPIAAELHAAALVLEQQHRS